MSARASVVGLTALLPATLLACAAKPCSQDAGSSSCTDVAWSIGIPSDATARALSIVATGKAKSGGTSLVVQTQVPVDESGALPSSALSATYSGLDSHPLKLRITVDDSWGGHALDFAISGLVSDGTDAGIVPSGESASVSITPKANAEVTGSATLAASDAGASSSLRFEPRGSSRTELTTGAGDLGAAYVISSDVARSAD